MQSQAQTCQKTNAVCYISSHAFWYHVSVCVENLPHTLQTMIRQGLCILNAHVLIELRCRPAHQSIRQHDRNYICQEPVQSCPSVECLNPMLAAKARLFGLGKKAAAVLLLCRPFLLPCAKILTLFFLPLHPCTPGCHYAEKGGKLCPMNTRTWNA